MKNDREFYIIYTHIATQYKYYIVNFPLKAPTNIDSYIAYKNRHIPDLLYYMNLKCAIACWKLYLMNFMYFHLTRNSFDGKSIYFVYVN